MLRWRRLQGERQMNKSGFDSTEYLRRQIGDILNRNTEPQFLRLALTKLAVLEQVYWEQRQKGGDRV